jgi:hypothetical protein
MKLKQVFPLPEFYGMQSIHSRPMGFTPEAVASLQDRRQNVPP